MPFLLSPAGELWLVLKDSAQKSNPTVLQVRIGISLLYELVVFFFFTLLLLKHAATLNCNDLDVFAFPLEGKLLKSVSLSYSHQVAQCPALHQHSNNHSLNRPETQKGFDARTWHRSIIYKLSINFIKGNSWVFIYLCSTLMGERHSKVYPCAQKYTILSLKKRH